MLGNAHHNPDHPDLLRFAEPVPAHRITITAGKFSVFDIFDDNRYAHEARLHFMNWGFVAGAAFDFSADAKGFTNGLALEWDAGNWGLRAGAFQVARRLNSLSLDPQPGRGHQFLVQLDRFWFINGHQGAVRLLGGYSRTRSSTWNMLLENDIEATLVNPTGHYSVKRMAVLNFEQELAEGLGLFARLSWNDGKAQNWMYTEMDRAASAGLDIEGLHWGRPDDSFGLAVNVGGISPSHRRFLEAGGIGFITGDGRLRYRPEVAVETYYATHIARGVQLTGDVQLVANPAYNADRGPIAFFALRLRSAF
jgi:high affinity Mn2+ porin